MSYVVLGLWGGFNEGFNTQASLFALLVVSLVTTPCVILLQLKLGVIKHVFPKLSENKVIYQESLCGDSEHYIGNKNIMPFIGKVEEFQEHNIWIKYTERLDQYFLANGITDNGKKWALLLSSCGAKTNKLIRSLVSLWKQSDKTFAELVNIVQNHLNPSVLPKF